MVVIDVSVQLKTIFFLVSAAAKLKTTGWTHILHKWDCHLYNNSTFCLNVLILFFLFSLALQFSFRCMKRSYETWASNTIKLFFVSHHFRIWRYVQKKNNMKNRRVKPLIQDFILTGLIKNFLRHFFFLILLRRGFVLSICCDCYTVRIVKIKEVGALKTREKKKKITEKKWKTLYCRNNVVPNYEK